MDIDELIGDYSRILITQNKTKKYLDHMIDETNKIINQYFPGMNIYNLDEIDYNEHLDEMNDYSYEVKVNIIPKEILKLMLREGKKSTNKRVKRGRKSFIQEYSRGDFYNYIFLINHEGMAIITWDINGNGSLNVKLNYDNMLYVLFILNYNSYVDFVEDKMRRINE